MSASQVPPARIRKRPVHPVPSATTAACACRGHADSYLGVLQDEAQLGREGDVGTHVSASQHSPRRATRAIASRAVPRKGSRPRRPVAQGGRVAVQRAGVGPSIAGLAPHLSEEQPTSHISQYGTLRHTSKAAAMSLAVAARTRKAPPSSAIAVGGLARRVRTQPWTLQALRCYSRMARSSLCWRLRPSSYVRADAHASARARRGRAVTPVRDCHDHAPRRRSSCPPVPSRISAVKAFGAILLSRSSVN
jgi:hypothetical protein